MPWGFTVIALLGTAIGFSFAGAGGLIAGLVAGIGLGGVFEALTQNNSQGNFFSNLFKSKDSKQNGSGQGQGNAKGNGAQAGAPETPKKDTPKPGSKAADDAADQAKKLGLDDDSANTLKTLVEKGGSAIRTPHNAEQDASLLWNSTKFYGGGLGIIGTAAWVIGRPLYGLIEPVEIRSPVLESGRPTGGYTITYQPRAGFGRIKGFLWGIYNTFAEPLGVVKGGVVKTASAINTVRRIAYPPINPSTPSAAPAPANTNAPTPVEATNPSSQRSGFMDDPRYARSSPSDAPPNTSPSASSEPHAAGASAPNTPDSAPRNLEWERIKAQVTKALGQDKLYSGGRGAKRGSHTVQDPQAAEIVDHITNTIENLANQSNPQAQQLKNGLEKGEAWAKQVVQKMGDEYHAARQAQTSDKPVPHEFLADSMRKQVEAHNSAPSASNASTASAPAPAEKPPGFLRRAKEFISGGIRDAVKGVKETATGIGQGFVDRAGAPPRSKMNLPTFLARWAAGGDKTTKTPVARAPSNDAGKTGTGNTQTQDHTHSGETLPKSAAETKVTVDPTQVPPVPEGGDGASLTRENAASKPVSRPGINNPRGTANGYDRSIIGPGGEVVGLPMDGAFPPEPPVSTAARLNQPKTTSSEPTSFSPTMEQKPLAPAQEHPAAHGRGQAGVGLGMNIHYAVGSTLEFYRLSKDNTLSPTEKAAWMTLQGSNAIVGTVGTVKDAGALLNPGIAGGGLKLAGAASALGMVNEGVGLVHSLRSDDPYVKWGGTLQHGGGLVVSGVGTVGAGMALAGVEGGTALVGLAGTAGLVTLPFVAVAMGLNYAAENMDAALVEDYRNMQKAHQDAGGDAGVSRRFVNIPGAKPRADDDYNCLPNFLKLTDQLNLHYQNGEPINLRKLLDENPEAFCKVAGQIAIRERSWAEKTNYAAFNPVGRTDEGHESIFGGGKYENVDRKKLEERIDLARRIGYAGLGAIAEVSGSLPGNASNYEQRLRKYWKVKAYPEKVTQLGHLQDIYIGLNQAKLSGRFAIKQLEKLGITDSEKKEFRDDFRTAYNEKDVPALIKAKDLELLNHISLGYVNNSPSSNLHRENRNKLLEDIHGFLVKNNLVREGEWENGLREKIDKGRLSGDFLQKRVHVYSATKSVFEKHAQKILFNKEMTKVEALLEKERKISGVRDQALAALDKVYGTMGAADFRTAKAEFEKKFDALQAAMFENREAPPGATKARMMEINRNAVMHGLEMDQEERSKGRKSTKALNELVERINDNGAAGYFAENARFLQKLELENRQDRFLVSLSANYQEYMQKVAHCFPQRLQASAQQEAKDYAAERGSVEEKDKRLREMALAAEKAMTQTGIDLPAISKEENGKRAKAAEIYKTALRNAQKELDVLTSEKHPDADHAARIDIQRAVVERLKLDHAKGEMHNTLLAMERIEQGKREYQKQTAALLKQLEKTTDQALPESVAALYQEAQKQRENLKTAQGKKDGAGIATAEIAALRAERKFAEAAMETLKSASAHKESQKSASAAPVSPAQEEAAKLKLGRVIAGLMPAARKPVENLPVSDVGKAGGAPYTPVVQSTDRSQQQTA